MSNKNFCSYPFSSMFTYNTGKVKVCCESTEIMGNAQGSESFNDIWNSEKWKKLRSEFLAGQKPKGCETCWFNEAANVRSSRENQNFEKYKGLTDQDGKISTGPEYLSFRLGNMCNYACVMCNPNDSSKWNDDINIFKKYFPEEEIVDGSTISDITEIDAYLGNLKRLYFLGGEPFLIKSHHKILDKLIEMDRAKDVAVFYHTNGSVFPEELLDRFKEFKYIEVSISIEGTGSSYEYIRYPGSWSNIVENLKRFDQIDLPNFYYNIMSIYFILTAPAIEEIFEWRESVSWRKRPEILFQSLENPKFLDVSNFSPAVKESLLNKIDKVISSSTVSGTEKDYLKEQKVKLREGINSEMKGVTNNFVSYFNDLDRARKTSLMHSIPSIKKIIELEEL